MLCSLVRCIAPAKLRFQSVNVNLQDVSDGWCSGDNGQSWIIFLLLLHTIPGHCKVSVCEHWVNNQYRKACLDSQTQAMTRRVTIDMNAERAQMIALQVQQPAEVSHFVATAAIQAWTNHPFELVSDDRSFRARAEWEYEAQHWDNGAFRAAQHRRTWPCASWRCPGAFGVASLVCITLLGCAAVTTSES